MHPRAPIWGKPTSKILTRLLWIDFSSHPHSQLSFLTFHGEKQHNRGESSYIPWSRSSRKPSHPRNVSHPPHLPLIPCKGKLQARTTPFYIGTDHWSNVSIVFRNTIYPCTHLVLTLIFPCTSMVIVLPQCDDPFSQGSEVNTQDIPSKWSPDGGAQRWVAHRINRWC